MSQNEKQAGKHAPEKNANAQKGVAPTGQLAELLSALGPHLREGEAPVDGLERLLGELGGLRAMVGSDATGRGLFVRYERGPGYEKGGHYSLHLVDVVPGTVQVTAIGTLGRVVQTERGGELAETTVGPWSNVRSEMERLIVDFVTPGDLR